MTQRADGIECGRLESVKYENIQHARTPTSLPRSHQPSHAFRQQGSSGVWWISGVSGQQQLRCSFVPRASGSSGPPLVPRQPFLRTSIHVEVLHIACTSLMTSMNSRRTEVLELLPVPSRNDGTYLEQQHWHAVLYRIGSEVP